MRKAGRTAAVGPRARRSLGAIFVLMLASAIGGTSASAAQAFSVSGVVTAQSTGVGVAETQVDVDESGTGVEVASTITALDGSYSVSVPEGTYDIGFTPPPGSGYEDRVDHGELVAEDVTLNVALATTKLSQTVSFTSSAPANPTVGSVYAVAAEASSGLPVSFSIDAASTAGACSVTEATVSFAGVGRCVIDADQSGDEAYLPAAQEQQTLEVVKASQTVSFTSSAPAKPTVGSAYAVAAEASSGLPVSLTIDAASRFAACSVFRGIVSFTNAGLCVIDANQSGDGGHLAAPQVQQRIEISSAQAPTTTTLSLAASTVEYGGEQSQIFSVSTTSPENGTIPSGTVAVKSGSRTLCDATLSYGSGSCSLSSTSLKPGSESVVGVFARSPHFSSSTSGAEAFSVTKDSTAASLTLSAGSVAFGNEQTETFKVTVSAGGEVAPSGSVTVKAGSKTICKASLSHESATCSPKATTLARGSYTVEAIYAGNSTLASSASSGSSLDIG